MRPKKKKKCATTSNAPTALVALLPPKATTTKKTWTHATLLTSTPIKNAPIAENEKVAEITKKTTGFARDVRCGRAKRLATTAEVPSVIGTTLILAGRMTVKSSGATRAVTNTWKNTSAKGTARTNHPPLGLGLLKCKHISRIKWPVDSSSLL